ncbi:MAG TPA: putative metallopeptidase [Bacillota bacterium]|jgi:hypothetical protein
MPDYQPADLYAGYAKALVRKMPELRHVPIGSIVFVENVAKAAKPTRRRRLSSVFKAPKKKLVKYAACRKLSPLIHYLTGKSYVIEVFQDACQNFSREKMAILMYHELKHIAEDGKLAKHDIEEWGLVTRAIGADWTITQRILPDILASDFSWAKYRAPQVTFADVVEEGQPKAAAAAATH